MAQNCSVPTVPPSISMNRSILFRSGNWCHGNGLPLGSKKKFPRRFMVPWLPSHACHTTSHYITSLCTLNNLFSKGSCKNQLTLRIDFLCCVVLCCAVLCGVVFFLFFELFCVVFCCSSLFFVLVCCVVSRCVVLCCVVLCSSLFFVLFLCCVVSCCIVLCCAVLCCVF